MKPRHIIWLAIIAAMFFAIALSAKHTDWQFSMVSYWIGFFVAAVNTIVFYILPDAERNRKSGIRNIHI